MRTLALLFSILFSGIATFAQINLVPNGSFEGYSVCPDDMNQINVCNDWYNISPLSPDFYNGCADTIIDIPNNLFGTQLARTGVAYAGIYVAQPVAAPNVKEYITVKLTQPLTAGVEYKLEFYVSLSDTSKLACSAIGGYFGVTDAFPANAFMMNVSEQVAYTGPVLDDKDNWQLISGVFTAAGGEEFLTIGNFEDDANSGLIDLGITHNLSYYYIDDVSVVINDGVIKGVDDIETFTNYNLYPNPITSTSVLEFDNPNNEELTLSIFDCHGKPVKNQAGINGSSVSIDKNSLSDGSYFFQLRSSFGVFSAGKFTVLTK